MKLNKTSLGLILILSIMLIISGCSTELSIASNEFKLPPYPPERKVVEPVWGTMYCKYSENLYESSKLGMNKCTEEVCGGNYDPGLFEDKDNKYVYYSIVNCPIEAGSRECTFSFDNFKCPANTFKYMAIGKRGSPEKIEDNFNDNLRINDDNVLVQIFCQTNFLNIRKEMTSAPVLVVEQDKRGIWIETEGFGRQGWMSGSFPDCRWASSNYVSELIKTQKKDSDIDVMSHIKWDESIDLNVGWREVPAVGNVNIMGKYKNKDVVCRVSATHGGSELLEVQEFSTKGDRDYYFMAGNILDAGADYCCSNNQCSKGLVCEDYKCVRDAECESGECNWWQKGQTISKDRCIHINGVSKLETVKCDNDACVQNSYEKVACCQNDCPANYECDYDVGCVYVGNKVDCPTGYCCEKDHVKYTQQNCASNLKCCIGDTPDDNKLGICKVSCDIDKEICDDGEDNDGDGLVDLADPDCKKNDPAINLIWIIWMMTILGLIGGIFLVWNSEDEIWIKAIKVILLTAVGGILGTIVVVIIKAIITLLLALKLALAPLAKITDFLSKIFGG